MNLNEATLRSHKPVISGIAVAAAIIAGPSIHRELGWLASMIPVPILYYFVLYGQKKGGTIIAGATVCAALVAAFLGSLTYYLFTLTMLPVGLALAQGALRKDSLIIAGLKGVTLLAGSWLLFAAIYSLGNQTSFYRELLEGVDKSLEATLLLYRESGQFSADALKDIEYFLDSVRQLIGQVLPSVILSSIICAVWMNILIGQWLLKKRDATLLPWQNLKEWRLPEPFVWGVILAGAAFLLPGKSLNTIGLNLGLVLGTLYFTQGIAVLSFFLNKWSVPATVKMIIYAMLILQIYGLALLAGIGLADVWLDFRKKKQEETTDYI